MFTMRPAQPDPADLESKLGEVAKLAVEVATAKGWNAGIDAFDKEKGRFASIFVERNFSHDRFVSGNLEFSLVGASLKLKTEQTSFHGTGLSDLQDSVWTALRELSWFPKEKKAQAPKLSPDIDLVSRVLRRFHRAARQLKYRHADRQQLRIKDEYDVQDFLHALLRALFDDVRAEEYTPSYAGGSSRIDFLLKSEKIAIEVKIASPNLRDKKIGEQLIIDIARYEAHPDTQVLFCFVYDPEGEIANPAGLEADLSGKQKKLDVRVIVVSPN